MIDSTYLELVTIPKLYPFLHSQKKNKIHSCYLVEKENEFLVLPGKKTSTFTC